MNNKFLLAGAMTALVLGTAPASAALFNIDYYATYTENPGVGVSVFGTPFFSESINDVSYIDFNAPGAPLGRPNAGGPFAAIITGSFTVTGTSQVFTVGSDDGAYVFLDGVLAAANPGIHAYSTINANGSFTAGTHAFRVEYFNGPCCGAAFGISATGVTFVPPSTGAVPEPATWAMMIAGFGIAGAALRRRAAPAAVRFA